MKKKLSLILALACALSFGLSACDGNTPAPEETPHTHTQSNALSSDGENHWYACVGCDEKFDIGAHTKNPMLLSDGEYEWYECVVCEAIMEKTAHTHSAGTSYLSSTATHWHECTVCGEKIDETAHQEPQDWTATDEYAHAKACEICTAPLASDLHSVDETAWVENGTIHTQDCGDCDKTVAEAHSALAGYQKSEGKHWQTCKCGATLNEREHSVSTVNRATYQAYCECGEIVGQVNVQLPLQAIDLAVVDGVKTATTGSIDLSSVSEDDFTVTSVTIGEDTIAGAMDSNKIYSFSLADYSASSTGRKSLSLTLNWRGVEVSLSSEIAFATKVIKTLDDLAAVRYTGDSSNSSSNAYATYGYFVLGGNIDGAGATLGDAKPTWQQDIGFRGTFDGLGYKISNVKVGSNGLFGALCYGSKVKDFTLEGTLTNYGLAYALRTATLENVTVKITGGSGTAAIAREINGSSVTNCTIDVSAATVTDAISTSGSGFTKVTVIAKQGAAFVGGSTAVPSGVTVQYAD
ncbi:MAG: hypothetical protein IJX96_02225 [Clostridia bacterium]|nr:hypothetical protein [Clostridia bacterium]